MRQRGKLNEWCFSRCPCTQFAECESDIPFMIVGLNVTPRFRKDTKLKWIGNEVILKSGPGTGPGVISDRLRIYFDRIPYSTILDSLNPCIGGTLGGRWWSLGSGGCRASNSLRDWYEQSAFLPIVITHLFLWLACYFIVSLWYLFQCFCISSPAWVPLLILLVKCKTILLLSLADRMAQKR